MDSSTQDDSIASLYAEGKRLRLKSDPGRIGTCTGRVRERARVWMVQVRFGNSSAAWYPDFELEFAEEPPPDDAEAIRTGRFGRAVDLRRKLTHIQLSGRLADLVYSMNTTNTDFYAHQYKPVLSFLESPSRGLLIADEVGLGKTIEAGLIWTELRARVDARRLLVVCPKMLCDKWRLELRNRFGVDATIVDAAELTNELQRPRPQFPASQAMIASIQGIRPPLNWEEDADSDSNRRRLAAVLHGAAGQAPLLDLVIIDEAHYLRNPETATHQLGLFLRDVAEHIVLLTATPINLKNEDLFSLLNLVDPDSFVYREQFEHVLAANEPLVLARLAALANNSSAEAVLAHLAKARRYSMLAGSKQLESLTTELESWGDRPWREAERVRLADRIERVNALSRILTRTRKVEVTERKVVRHPSVQRIVMSTEESAFYALVTNAIKQYAWENDISDGFLLATPQRQLSSCMYAAAASWSTQDSEEIEEMLYEDLGVESKADVISGFRQFLLNQIRGKYELARLRKSDSKFDCLAKTLVRFFSNYPREKVVLFSYFRGTLRYLKDRFEELGIETTVLMGGMKEDKSQVIDEFREDPTIRVLLSSEVASEGVDLQFCRFLVNYDLPWNPMKVEQRIGRIDRLGQAAEKIDILNLVYAETIDARIVQRLYERLDLFRRALGGLEAVLGEEIQQLTAELLTGRLTPAEEEERITQTALALENRNRSEQELEDRAGQLIAHSDYILKKVHAARDFSRQITADDLLVYVRDYLERFAPGHRWFQPGVDSYEIDLTLPPAVSARLDSFIATKRLYGLTRLAEGSTIRCRFANKVRTGATPHEQLSQFHPLIRFISEEVNREELSATGLLCIQLAGNVRSGNPVRPGLFAFVVQRWIFDGLRTEESVRARAMDLGSLEVLGPDASSNIVNAARVFGTDWPGATGDLDAVRAAKALEEIEFRLIDDFGEERVQKESENADRIQFQLHAVQTYLERKQHVEEQRIANLGSDPRNRGLVVAAERTITRLTERFALQMAKLDQARSVGSKRDPIAKGIILIEGAMHGGLEERSPASC
jgi:superfamily II DNA or RNA helicase